MDRGSSQIVTEVRARTGSSEGLHVLTLSVFAVAQPLFDLLGRNASFFVAHRASRMDVVAFSVVTFLAPAAVLIVARVLISRDSRSAAHVFHLVTLAILGALAIAPPVVRAWGAHWVPAVALGIAVGVVVVSAYRRFGGFRRFLSFLGVATFAFPILFLFATPVRDIILPQRLPSSELARAVEPVTTSEVPVLIGLFDELSITSLITPRGDINAKRYPNFAELARRSTWYREATTVGLRTDQAVPAILTGRRVPRRQVPSSFAYPDNLFTLMSRTHELHVHESVTQLCPPELCRLTVGEATTGLRSLALDTSVVYGHLVLPVGLADRLLPPLGDRWSGFTKGELGVPGPGDIGGGDPVKAWLRSALAAARDQHEGLVFEDLLRGVKKTSKPQLSWAHVQIPHPPWRYLPTGQVYPIDVTTPGYHGYRWSEDPYLVDEGLQRSLLQTKYADALVGRMIERLERAGTWDRTMVVVVADHGATWAPGKSRRDVGGDQRAGLLGVPMFIKYPEQQRGRIDPRNAETTDVLPTIADVAGVRVPWQTHGVSLRGPKRNATKRVFDGTRDRTVDYSFADARNRAAEIEELFGRWRGADDLYEFGRDGALVGEDVASFEVASRTSATAVDIHRRDAYRRVDPDGPVLPVFLRAQLSRPPDDARRVAVALNGHIAGVGRTFEDEGRTQIAVLLSPRFLREGDNRIDVYFIDEDGVLVRLAS